MNHITMFNKPYSEDKIAEGLAISYAVQNGICHKCEYKFYCTSNHVFEFPENAPCMHIKRKIRRGILK
jgi:hypothetical protein